MNGPKDIDFGIEHRLYDTASQIHLRGVVIDVVGALGFEDLAHCLVVPNVSVVKPRSRIEVFDGSAGKIINDHHIQTLLEICIDNMGCNKPSSPSYQSLHALLL